MKCYRKIYMKNFFPLLCPFLLFHHVLYKNEVLNFEIYIKFNIQSVQCIEEIMCKKLLKHVSNVDRFHEWKYCILLAIFLLFLYHKNYKTLFHKTGFQLNSLQKKLLFKLFNYSLLTLYFILLCFFFNS